MKVLFAAAHVASGPSPIGGVQTWIRTLRRQLANLGHESAEWEPGQPLDGTFDLGVFAHIDRTRPALAHCRRSLLVSHGVIDAERPGEGCDLVAAVSEEVCDRWGIDGPIIRQPIELNYWRPAKQSKTLARFAYRRGHTMSAEVAEALGLRFDRITGLTPPLVRGRVASAAVVHASGRAALEAMACDVPTVIYDHRAQYQGPLLGHFEDGISCNYSGRTGIADPSLQQVIDATREAMLRRDWRGYVRQFHDAEKIARQMLCLNY